MNRCRLAALCLAAAVAVPVTGQTPPADPPSRESLLRVAEKVRKKLVSLSNYGVFDAILFRRGGVSGRLQSHPQKGSTSIWLSTDSTSSTSLRMCEAESLSVGREASPLSRMDDDIRGAAYLKIYGHPVLSRYNPIAARRSTAVCGLTAHPHDGNLQRSAARHPPDRHHCESR